MGVSILSTAIVKLYVRFPNGRIVVARIDPDRCLDEAKTMIMAGATYVGVEPMIASAGPWQFTRPIGPRKAANPMRYSRPTSTGEPREDER